MVKNEKDAVGFREYFAILYFSIAIKSTDMTAVLLYRDGLNAAWMIVIGGFLIILPSLLFLNNVLNKYQSKHILEIIQLTFGKPIALVLAFIMFCYTFTNTASDTRSYVDQLITINFPRTPLFVLYLCFLIVCICVAKMGWETIAEIAWIVFPFLMLSLGLLIIFSLKDASFNRIFPLFGNGGWAIAKGSVRATALFSDLFVFMILYPMVKDHKTYTRSLYSSIIFSVVVMVFMYLTYLCIFDYRSIDKIMYPFNDLTRFISIGRMLSNVETFFITVWLVAIFIKFSMYLYVVSKIFGFVFNIKEYENTIIPIGLLILMAGMIPENEAINLFEIRKQTSSYFIYFVLTVPPLLSIVTKLKGVKTG